MRQRQAGMLTAVLAGKDPKIERCHNAFWSDAREASLLMRFSQIAWPQTHREKSSVKLKLRSILQNNWPMFFKSVKVMKDKNNGPGFLKTVKVMRDKNKKNERVRSCSRLKEPKETWQLNQCGILDYILDQKKNISETIGNIWMKSVALH